MKYCAMHNFTYMELTCPMCDGKPMYSGIMGDATQQAFGPITLTDYVKPAKPAPAIGDLSSTEKGTGARYNGGKTPYELIAWGAFAGGLFAGNNEDARRNVRSALTSLGLFQAGGDARDLKEVLMYTAAAADLSMVELASETARVLEYGKLKYTEWNWAKGMSWQSVIACCARHLLGTPEHRGMWDEPRGIDHDSGRMHAGHVGCNVLFLQQFMLTYREGDDRPKILQDLPF